MTLAQRADKIGAELAGPAADAVDRDARFPSEAVDGLRADRMLSALIPTDLGGGGATVEQAAASVTALARYCSSAAMVLAMHHIQVACLVRHGRTDLLEDFLRQVAADELLLASATTEIGVGGDVRTSICAVERAGGRFTLEKQAPVISYGEQAFAVLATARRASDSPPSDQVLVLCRPPHLGLEATSGWDTLGFRGTCSLGFRLTAADDEAAILADPYGDISSQTMLPVSHIVWASVWLGIASAATDRARQFVREAARKTPGATPPSAVQLAELMIIQQEFEELVRAATARFESLADDREAMGGMGVAIGMNSLKVAASRLVVDVVSRALAICGMAGYRHDSPYTMGRLLRDAFGAALMVNNDRLLGNNAQMLLIHRGDA